MLISATALLAAAVVVVSANPAPVAKNFFLIAVDDLRPMFGESFGCALHHSLGLGFDSVFAGIRRY